VDTSFDWSDPIAVERELKKVGKELVPSYKYGYQPSWPSGIVYRKEDKSPEAPAFLAHEVGHWQLGHNADGFGQELASWEAVLQQRRYYITRGTVQLKLQGYIAGIEDPTERVSPQCEMKKMLDKYF
jgi:hypothetical protein